MTGAEALTAVLTAILSAVSSGGAVIVVLRWLRADVNRAHTRLDAHDERIRELEIAP